MVKNKKQTSNNVASLAAKNLADNNSSQIAKKLAGSALSQKSTSKQTGSEMEDTAPTCCKATSCASQAKPTDTYSIIPTYLAIQ